MERFDPTIGNSDYEGEAWATMQADPFGEYVDHGEAQAEIARLQAEVERWKELHDQSEGLVAVVRAQRDTAWNDAIEAAADVFNWNECDFHSSDRKRIRAAIRALRKQP